ncbi:alpha-D-ribose 1-methylphosphonate 5-triphosphate synthase subunit PhnG [Roseovarius sp. MBR-79]|jgi:alpha-D-ribose 1-methylphosphonate 5-triphosphate synthase subunit PhnG
MTRPEREDWGAALAAADPAELAALAGRITDSAQVEAMAPPREGLMLMRLRDSVAGAAFHLGEVPVARVHLRLSRDGRTAEGGAVLMSDDLARVTRIAVLDAALAADWIEAPEIEALIAAGQAARARLEADRALVLDRTRVDFQLLSEEDE